MVDTIHIDSGNVKMIAHRGLSGLERENTNAAFVAAGMRSYYGIETDIHRTADGQFVVFHDDTTARLTELDWVVEEHTLAELKTLVLKDKDERFRSDLTLPTLDEYIRICKKYGKVAVLELKNHMEPEVIQKVIDMIRAEEYLEQTVFISFDLANMLCIRKTLPDQPAQYLVGKITDDLFDILVENKLDLDILHWELTAEFTARLHEAGRKVNVWTVDKPQHAQRVLEMGVDFITTNILE